MIILEFQNRIVAEALRSRVATASSGGKVKDVDITVADFDGIIYHVGNPNPEDKTLVTVSIKFDYWHQLAEHDVDGFIKNLYGDLVTDTEDGYNSTLLVNLASIPGDTEAFIGKIASFKRNCLAALYKKYFDLQASGGAGMDGSPSLIRYRPEETMFISAHRDRVTVVFSTKFSDEDDITIGKLFLQEFQEARKENQSAPQVLFKHKSPPSELSKFSEALTGDNVGYVTFVLFPRHIDAKNAENTIDLIHGFRTYLHYHLKCLKAYLHMRMRAQATSFLKVLNRAKPENETKQKKTFAGKSFVRK